MNRALSLRIEGVGLWGGPWRDWSEASATLTQDVAIASFAPPPRPSPTLLPATERRRAPESVLIAVEAAQQACAMAQRAPADLAHVFASAYGDLAINDYLCATLAGAPLEVSPTKFHNSVHNAPAGYWAIATGCRASSTAISAGPATFAAAMLEAAAVAAIDERPVLLVAYDVAACGPLVDAVDCDVPFAVALVLGPAAETDRANLRLSLREGALAPAAGLMHAWSARNPAARCLPLLAALAQRRSALLEAPIAPATILVTETLF